MSTNRAPTYAEDTSYADLLSLEETYEGSRHFAVEVDVDVDFEDYFDDPPSLTRTVIMSPSLLAELRAELIAEAERDAERAALHTRPTQRSMLAIRREPSG
jgi:hypothetical protein